jgi:hypothetical protein
MRAPEANAQAGDLGVAVTIVLDERVATEDTCSTNGKQAASWGARS